jgi:hypothetical protein
MAAAYGPAVLDLPFATYVQLWLNLPRVRLRRAAEVALGLKMAWGGASRQLAEALTETEAEAEELYTEMRLAEKEARAARKAGF